MEPKTTTLHNTCSRFLLWIRFDALAFRSKKVFWRRGPPPWWPIWPRPRSARGRYGLNIFMHVPGHEHFIPTKFREHPLSGSVVKAGYVFPYIYSKTWLQRISVDTSKNFVIAVIRYNDIAKFVILYNEFVLHKENKPGTMNMCWTLYIQIITQGSLSDNLKACEREMGHYSLIDIETPIFGFANERFFKLYVNCLVEFRIHLRCLSLVNPPFVQFVSSVIASFFLLGEAMILNNTFKYKGFVKTI